MTRRVLALLLFVALLTAVLPVGGRIPVADAEPAADGGAYMATCLQSAHSLSALFLYDKSGSLTSSDPNGIRYEGLKMALQNLAGVKRADGAPVAIEAAVSAFDSTYHQADTIVNWTTLNQGNDDDTAKTIDHIVDEAKNGSTPNGGTNFTDAMQGAWSDLKDRGSRGICRVVFWFTDGADEVNTVGNDPCRPDSGLIDQMRQAGIVVVGLQLGQPTDDLRAIATGNSGRVQCGRNPIPSDWAGGVYIQANDSAALRRLFGSLGNLVRGCTPQGARAGTIDPGVRSMNVTINTAAQVDTVRLDAPDGTVISAATRGSTTQGGYTTIAQSDASYVSLLVDFPPGRGAGTWVVSAGQAVTPHDLEFCVYSGLHLARVDPKVAPNAGGTADVVYHAVDGQGKEADLSEYKDVALGAAVVAANSEIRKATAIRDGNHIVVRVDTQPVDARLQVRLTAQPETVSGLVLSPLAVDEGVGFTLNKAFPTITPIDELNLGSAIKSKPATKDLMLLGSPLGPAKVCFYQATKLTVPGDQSGARLDAPNGCIDLARGESRTVRISVQPVQPTVGNGQAELPITLVPVADSEIAGQQARIDLPVVWRYENPREAVVLVAVIVAASLLSVALPFLALGLANLVTSRFDVDGLNGAAIAVLIGADGPRRVHPLQGNPDGVLDRYSMETVTVSDRRRFTYGAVEFRCTRHLSPFKMPTFTVRATAPGYRVLSSVPPPGTDGETAAATPGLGFLVVAVVAEADLASPAVREVPATLVVLIRDKDVPSAQLDALMNSRIEWTVITDRWRAGVEVHAGAATAEPGMGDDFRYLDDAPADPHSGDDFDYLDKNL